MRFSRAGMVACMWLAAGCAQIAAPPHLPVTPRPPRTLEGNHILTFHSRWTGSVRGRIELTEDTEGVRGHTRRGCAGELIGGIKGFLVNALGIGGLTEGVLIRWESPRPADGQPARGQLRLPMMKLATEFVAADQPIVVRQPGSGAVFGLATLQPAEHPPVLDYDAVVSEVRDALHQYLFDEAVLQAPATAALLRQLERLGRVARDDAEFFAGFMWSARGAGFSHFGIRRQLDPVFEEQLNRPAGDCRVDLRFNGDLATLRLRRFGTGRCVNQLDRAFERIADRDPAGLVIDLRNNTSGDYAWCRVVAHLFEGVTDVGWYVTRGQPRAVLQASPSEVVTLTLDRGGKHARVERPGHAAELLALADDSGAEVLLQFYRERGLGASRQQVVSANPVYLGPVAVLVNRMTYSGAECLAAALQERGRATIVGATATAGAALLPEEIALSDGWRLLVPVAAYLTPAGVGLERRGVEPDLRCERGAELQRAREWLRGPGDLRGSTIRSGSADAPDVRSEVAHPRNESSASAIR